MLRTMRTKPARLACLVACLALVSSVGAFEITAPESLKTSLGTIDTTEADFAPKAPEAGITGELVMAETGNEYGCNPLVDPAVDYTGKIVITKRGACMFSTKAINVFEAGGIACLVQNSNDELITMITAPFHYGGVVKVPTLMIKSTVGDSIIAQLATGTVTGFLKGTKLVDSEYAALSDFYLSTGGPNWAASDGSAIAGWTIDPTTGANTGGDPCLADGYGWRGVSCLDGKLVSLSVEAFNLTGSIPASFGDLTSLKNLYASYNSISGTLPTTLGNLAKLQEFDLSNNDIEGTIPTELCSITTFKDFRLSNNKLTGGIPQCGTPTSHPWTAATILRLNGNQLTGSIPDNLIEMTALTELWLDQNQLTGTFPAWITAPSRDVDDGAGGTTTFAPPLVTARIGKNKLSGTVPTLTGTIKLLSIEENSFSGSIETSFNALANMEQLEAGKNDFTGSFPSFSGCAAIKKIDLGDNSLTTWHTDLDFANIATLEILNIENNGMTCAAGSPSCFPTSFSDLSNLRTVFMSGNEITGSAQVVLGAFMKSAFTSKSLTSLDISNNKISSVMRATIHVWDALQEFRIANNSLTGPLPTLPMSASFIDFSGNGFTGSFEDNIAANTLLTELRANNNPGIKTEAEGVLPSHISATEIFVKDDSKTFSCPELIVTATGASLDVDPSFYSYSLCSCEKGYYPDPAPPTCTPFPTEVSETAASGTVTDGTSTGRIRDGLDTKWKIAADSAVKTIAITVVDNKLANASAGVLNVHEGDSVLDPLVYQPRVEDVNKTMYVFGNEALLHFTSEGTNGPYFEVTYTTSNDCPAGYSYDTVAAKCAPSSCPLGHYFARDENNEKKCFPCAMNTYQDEANTGSTCKNCPANSYTDSTGETSIQGCVCGDGYVGELGVFSTKCKSCLGMDGVSCSGPNMTVADGYYKAPASYETYECSPKKVCKYGEDMQYATQTTCKTGSHGPKCAVCLPGYYSIADTGCVKCGGKGGAIFGVAMIIVGVIFLYSIIFKFDLTSGSATVKIVMSFMQVLHMHLMYKLNWPSAFKDFLSIFGFIQFDFTDLSTPSCAFDSTVDFFTSFSFYMALIPVEILVVFIHYLIYKNVYAKRFEADERQEKIIAFRSMCFRNVLWLTTFTYPSVASKALQYFNCENIGGIDYMVADYAISCDSDYYKGGEPFGVIFTILYVALFPVFLVFLLMRMKSKKLAKQANQGEKSEVDTKGRKVGLSRPSVFTVNGKNLEVVSRIAFMIDCYIDDCFYWEVVDMMRKLMVAIVAIFVSDSHGANLLLTVFISMCYLQSLFLYKPYTKAIDQYTSVIAAFGLCVSLMGGLAIAIDAATGDDFGICLVVVNVFSLATVIVSASMETVSHLSDYSDVSFTALVKDRMGKGAAKTDAIPS